MTGAGAGLGVLMQLPVTHKCAACGGRGCLAPLLQPCQHREVPVHVGALRDLSKSRPMTWSRKGRSLMCMPMTARRRAENHAASSHSHRAKHSMFSCCFRAMC